MEPKRNITSLKLTRIDALTDGVFAIAMTLLILEIRVPLTDLIHSEKDLWIQLGALKHQLLSYFLSFLVLGIFWVAHNAQYSFITNTDRELLWINIIYLMFISFLPFSAALLSNFIQYQAAIAVYWFNLFAIGMTLLLNWMYAKRNNFIPVLKEHPGIHKIVLKRILIAQAFYVTALLVSFINPVISLWVFLGIQLFYTIPTSFDKRLRSLWKTR